MTKIKPIITAIKLTLSIVLLWVLVYTSKLNFSLLVDLLYSPFSLMIILSLYILNICIGTWRWHRLNHAQMIRLSFVRTLLPAYLGIAFNNLLPGGVGGDFYRFYLLNKHTQAKKSAVMMSILFDRLTGLMGIFIVTGFAALLQLNSASNSSFVQLIMLTCLLICCGTALIFIVSKLLPLGLTTQIYKSITQTKWLNPFLPLLSAIRIYSRSKWVIVECLILSVIIQVIIACTCMVIANMMHFPSIPLSHYVIAASITLIVNLIPITPGGFGVGEMAFANILTLLNPGISSTFATIFLAYRVIGLVTYLPGVSLFIFNSNALNMKNYHETAIDKNLS